MQWDFLFKLLSYLSKMYSGHICINIKHKGQNDRIIWSIYTMEDASVQYFRLLCWQHGTLLINHSMVKSTCTSMCLYCSLLFWAQRSYYRRMETTVKIVRAILRRGLVCKNPKRKSQKFCFPCWTWWKICQVYQIPLTNILELKLFNTVDILTVLCKYLLSSLVSTFVFAFPSINIEQTSKHTWWTFFLFFFHLHMSLTSENALCNICKE